MNRVNEILRHSHYRECLRTVEALESERPFCRHNMAHFLDVARLAWAENLEMGLGISKEWIYACGLLHDIGRHLQYLEGIPHHISSADLAGPILEDCGFSKEEREEILGAIRSHRDGSVREGRDLSGLLYRADKASRACFACPSEPACDWEPEKKNLFLLR